MEKAGQEQNPGLTTSSNDGSAKRKMDDPIEIAKQKAQEIAARLLNSAESKRPRLESTPTVPAPVAVSDLSSSIPTSQTYPVSYALQTSQQYNNSQGASKKTCIPNAKVGVIIGRGGDMIKNLQLRSGARIQITRDADADPTSLTRDIELMGTPDQISRAEQLIGEVIAESDAASGTAPSGERGISPLQPGSEQEVMRVPNDKVALIIGKGGETIKNMQSQSGARVQVVPLRLPPGDTSTERSVYITGTREQIESAKELLNEVMSGNRLKVLSASAGYTQAGYTPGGAWATPGQPPVQHQPGYGYLQQGTYSTAPAYYGSYPPQPASWDQSNPATVTPPPPPSMGYNPYGQSQPAAAPYNYGQAAAYNYGQGYPQQPPNYGQDVTSQVPPAYGMSASSSQPDGPVPAQTSQPGYGAPSQPEDTTQSQPPSAYQAGYGQPNPASTNGYGAYPGYGAPQPQPAYDQAAYSQAGYTQTTYGQQQGAQVPSQAVYPYYGQVGYPPAPEASAQASYYQGTYPPASGPPPAQPEGQLQSTNGGNADDGNSGDASGAASKETDDQKS